MLLCERLLAKIKLVDGVEPSEAEAAVAARDRSKEIARVSVEGVKLAEIATCLLNESNELHQIITNLPDGKGFFTGAGEVYSGFNSSSNDVMWSGIKKAAPDVIRGIQSALEIDQLATYHQGLAIKLAKLAPEFSGAQTNAGIPKCQFSVREEGLIFIDKFQFLSLSNSVGTDLHNCVIFVRLSDPDGKSYVNVHFAPLWPSAGQLVATYTDTDFTAKRLENVTKVEIAVSARECSFGPKVLTKPAAGWPELK